MTFQRQAKTTQEISEFVAANATVSAAAAGAGGAGGGGGAAEAPLPPPSQARATALQGGLQLEALQLGWAGLGSDRVCRMQRRYSNSSIAVAEHGWDGPCVFCVYGVVHFKSICHSVH